MIAKKTRICERNVYTLNPQKQFYFIWNKVSLYQGIEAKNINTKLNVTRDKETDKKYSDVIFILL